ncbi:MAG: NAD-dependent DNA ligase LigA [Saprospiraceae bacterium]|nr:NAD-dependent DNA ligase LigA [Saprospiraceae bacterium]
MYNSSQEKELFTLTRQMLDHLGDDAFPAHEHVQKLRQVLNYHEWKYYVQNSPLISDFEYDQLYKELERIEDENPELVTSDSPTQRVSSDLSPDFKTVQHLTSMLSLANSYDADDLKSFDESNKKLLNIEVNEDLEYCVEPKFDGGSIALIYEDDKLVRAATRGNGQEGDEITANIRTLKSIPLKANFSKFGISRIELRGEAIIRKDTFKKINQSREKQGLPVFANPRNAATGGLRMKDPGETAQRGIEAFIYQVAYTEDPEGRSSRILIRTQWEGMEMLQSLGFKVPTVERKRCKSIREVIDFCAEWQEKRDSYPYEIDGMVVKLNQVLQQREVGSTSHHPRWAIAYKFKAKQATTRLLKVEYQVGKVGSITPVAKVEPVQLAGVTVSSISLHNEEFIQNKDLRIGDQILIERAGDVIPYVVKSLSEVRDGNEVPIQFPEYCPINKKEKIPLVKEGNEAAWRCPNCTCGAQDLQRIVFHVSKDAMDIDGLGKSMIERFWDLGWIRDIADIYRLDYDKISELDGFGQRSAENLRKAVNKAKKNSLHRLLHSLSIHHLGKRSAKILAEKVNSVYDLENMTEEDLTGIKDIGPVLAKQIISFFHDKTKLDLIHRLEDAGVNVVQTESDRPKVVKDNAPLHDKTILFTGKLLQMGRKEAQQLAEENGAKNISAVSGNLDILVVGENAGSKLSKAQSLGSVQIMTEDEFLDLIRD